MGNIIILLFVFMLFFVVVMVVRIISGLIRYYKAISIKKKLEKRRKMKIGREEILEHEEYCQKTDCANCDKYKCYSFYELDKTSGKLEKVTICKNEAIKECKKEKERRKKSERI